MANLLNNEKYPLSLPNGTVLGGKFVTVNVLGQGGFGITYEATAPKTGERYAIKEYFPDSLAMRRNDLMVMPLSSDRDENFSYGKSTFLQEAETLADFIGNENIVRIHSYFEENGTAYFVMDYVEGISLDRYIKQNGGKILYEDAERILLPVMDALSAVHEKGIVHRDVTPDNIILTKDGNVKLIDFGAARYSLGDKSKSLDIVLKHGFAPKEQYVRRGKQGSFTDIYALGATFYFALTGRRPPDSIERLEDDNLIPPSLLGVSLPGKAEDAILTALNVSPQDRFQNVSEFKKALLSSQGNPVISPTLYVSSEITVPTSYVSNEIITPEYAQIEEPAIQLGKEEKTEKERKKTPFAKKLKWIIPSAVAVIAVGGLIIVLAPQIINSIENQGPAEPINSHSDDSSVVTTQLPEIKPGIDDEILNPIIAEPEIVKPDDEMIDNNWLGWFDSFYYAANFNLMDDDINTYKAYAIKPIEIMVPNGEEQYLRADADTSSKIITEIKSNNRYKIVGYKDSSDDKRWLILEDSILNEICGYIRADIVYGW